MGTINMLGLAKRVKARILLASTSEIYGDPQVHPQPESYWGNVNTIGIRACYDEGKRVAETMMYAYKNQNNVDVRVARIFVSLQGRFFRKFRFMYDRLHLYRIHLAQGCTRSCPKRRGTSGLKEGAQPKKRGVYLAERGGIFSPGRGETQTLYIWAQ